MGLQKIQAPLTKPRTNQVSQGGQAARGRGKTSKAGTQCSLEAPKSKESRSESQVAASQPKKSDACEELDEKALQLALYGHRHTDGGSLSLDSQK